MTQNCLFIISEEETQNIKNFFPGYHNGLKLQSSILSFVMNLTGKKKHIKARFIHAPQYLTFIFRRKVAHIHTQAYINSMYVKLISLYKYR